MVEKQASSEIAQSRERFEKWLKGEPIEVKTLNRTNGHYVVFDIEKMWNSYQQAERDIRERCAQVATDRAESLRNTKCQAETSERNFHILDACQGELESLAERIRGKE